MCKLEPPLVVKLCQHCSDMATSSDTLPESERQHRLMKPKGEYSLPTKLVHVLTRCIHAESNHTPHGILYHSSCISMC